MLTRRNAIQSVIATTLMCDMQNSATEFKPVRIDKQVIPTGSSRSDSIMRELLIGNLVDQVLSANGIKSPDELPSGEFEFAVRFIPRE